ncbi:MAG TPA: LysR substrate-binding domain-containing protein, partial [Gammaproteobacteria bacterium]|nr:LysR substrate-binding domain-containing protein [Gammaproteobacteria bacterium]
VDVAIRHFKARENAELDIEFLFLDDIRVYCTPKYREEIELTKPDDLARATLLAGRIHPYWERWFMRFAKLSAQEIREIPIINFDASHLAIDTAKRQQGVVLTCASLVEHEVASGELIEPFEARLPVDEGYYLVGPKGCFAPGSVVESLRVWLRASCAR